MHSNLVTPEWLLAHLDSKNLVILDASISQVGKKTTGDASELQLPKSRFFDLKNKFSDQAAPFPNTIPSAKQFEREAQNLGIKLNSHIIIYDDLGIYSSPRAWWLFKLMGFENVAVLDGGLPAWKNANYPLEKRINFKWSKGNFKSDFTSSLLCAFETIQSKTKTSTFKIIDARSSERFLGLEPEPRAGLRGGHIPNSINLPYNKVLTANSFADEDTLKSIFNNFAEEQNHFVFSCGSGVTACILALAAEIMGYSNYAVYDGSWTEYGSLTQQ